MIKQYEQAYKVIIAGSSGVGKSCLLLRYVDNIFSSNTLSTIGVDFKFKTINMDGNTVKLQIWDTAGSQAFRSIVSAYYRGANAIVLVFKIDDKLTFQQLSDFWMIQINKYKDTDCQIMLLANMCDLDTSTKIPKQQIDRFMQKNNISLFAQTSAKTGHGVVEAFKQLASKMMKKNKRQKASGRKQYQHLKMSIGSPQQTQKKKKKGCC